MEKYNFQLIEKKWQSFFENNKIYLTKKNKKKKILLSRDVSIPIRKYPYGSCKKLYSR